MSKFLIIIAAFVLSTPSLAASVVGKSWSKQESTIDCGNGRRGTKCFSYANIELTWDTPVEREDGASLPLHEILYYIISKSKDGGQKEFIAVPRVNSFTLRFMPTGVYTFEISTVDSDRLQGNFSDSIQVTII